MRELYKHILPAFLIATACSALPIYPEKNSGEDTDTYSSFSVIQFLDMDGGSHDTLSPIDTVVDNSGVDSESTSSEDTETDAGPDSCLRYVSKSGSPDGDGKEWSSALDSVQDAIDSVATSCPESGRVWVAEGTYFVYQSSPLDTIQPAENVHIFGGFDGTESSLEQRNFEQNITILDGRSETGIDLDAGTEDERVHHVITAAESFVIDGFTVSNGLAIDGETQPTIDNDGGGLFLNSVPTAEIRNCIFENNEATYGGGVGIYQSYATFTNCRFIDNHASAQGGGVFLSHSPTSSTSFENCHFLNNSTEGSGGAVCSGWGTFTTNVAKFEMNRCFFVENQAENGGAVFITTNGNQAFITNSIFFANNANANGGGFFASGALVSLTHVTISSNAAVQGGTAYLMATGGALSLANSIVWGDETVSGSDINDSMASYEAVETTNCNIEGGFEGSGNIDSDPIFVDGSSDTGLMLQPGSPCIDAANGSMSTPVDVIGNPRVDIETAPNGNICDDAEPEVFCVDWADMGAYELQ